MDFLSQSDPSKPATVNTAVWQKILDHQNLKLITDDTTLLHPPQGSTDGTVYLRWTPKGTPDAGTNQPLSYDFSSERNSKYFGEVPALESGLQNSACIGDGAGCR